MPSLPQHVLIVDDEPRIAELVRKYLSLEGYRVSTARDGEAMFQVLGDGPVDLILLDLVMPGRDGLALTRLVRERSSVPIIMLTGQGDTIDRVVGLENGADDYMTKPFDLRELLARVRSVLRRRSLEASPARTEPGYRFAGWLLDPAARQLTSPEGQDVPLTTAEYNLLSVFVESPNRVLTRDHLLDRVSSRRSDPFDRSIDVMIGRLRRKLGDDAAELPMVKTVRGAGYVFTAKVTPR